MSQDNQIKKVLIVGGGTAGWMTAAALSRAFSTIGMRIQLVESEAIGTVGVGEATIPSIATFNRLLGIDEAAFLRQTNATFKLGILFDGWDQKNKDYIHPFGEFGTALGELSFTQYWHKASSELGLKELGDYSISVQAARLGRFSHARPTKKSPLENIRHAYHFDSEAYAVLLRDYAEQRGVTRTEGEISSVQCNQLDGNIEKVRLKDGSELSADFFIDCSGFRSLLLGNELGVPWIDWSEYLPNDRAVVVPSEKKQNIPSYTLSKAHKVGWQWEIPLQHRTGNGHVYSSQFTNDGDAQQVLMNHLTTKPIADPRVIKFSAGRRAKAWQNNCVGIGLSGGFLEPLESTGVYLIQSAIIKLVELFPGGSGIEANRNKYNQLMDDDFDSVRDFIILHYYANRREGEAYWDHCRTMKLPSSLEDKISLYKDSGRIYRDNGELFGEASWLAVFEGQGIKPNAYQPMADVLDSSHLAASMNNIREVIAKTSNSLLPHEEYIRRFLAQ